MCLRGPFRIVLSVAVAMFDPVLDHHLQLAQSLGFSRIVVMTVPMRMMFMTVVHSSSVRVIVSIVAVAVDMGRMAVPVRVFVDQVDLEQQIVVDDDLGKRPVRGKSVV